MKSTDGISHFHENHHPVDSVLKQWKVTCPLKKQQKSKAVIVLISCKGLEGVWNDELELRSGKYCDTENEHQEHPFSALTPPTNRKSSKPKSSAKLDNICKWLKKEVETLSPAHETRLIWTRIMCSEINFSLLQLSLILSHPSENQVAAIYLEK